MDLKKCHEILLVDNEDYADQILKEKKCKRVILPSGRTIQEPQFSETHCFSKSLTAKIKINTDSKIKHYEKLWHEIIQNIKDREDLITTLNQEYKDTQTSFNEIKQSISEVTLKINELQNRKLDSNAQIEEIKRTLFLNKTKMDSANDMYEKQKKILAAQIDKNKKLKEKKNIMKQKIYDMENNEPNLPDIQTPTIAQEQTKKDLEEEGAKLKLMIGDIQQKIMKSKATFQNHEKTYKMNFNEAKQNFSKYRDQFYQKKYHLKQVSKELETLNQQASNHLSQEEIHSIQQRNGELKISIDRSKRSLEACESFLEASKKSIELMKKEHEAHLFNCSKIVESSFILSQEQKGFKSTIKIESTKEKLTISTFQKGSSEISLEQLSGGERSISQISFLISIWQVIECLFFQLTNSMFSLIQKIRMKLSLFLMNISKQKKGQFFFMTPSQIYEFQDENEISFFLI